MKFLLPLSLACLCLAGLPARAEEEPAPVGGDRPQVYAPQSDAPQSDVPQSDAPRGDAVISARQADMDADRQDAKCRVAKTVEMGIAFGGGQVRRQVGARLDYGQDVAGLPAGVALPPCPTNGLALSLAVSSSDGGFGRVSEGSPAQSQGPFTGPGRGPGRGPGGNPPPR